MSQKSRSQIRQLKKAKRMLIMISENLSPTKGNEPPMASLCNDLAMKLTEIIEESSEKK